MIPLSEARVREIVREELAATRNVNFRALVNDLERLERSGLSFDDQARDLLLSYDITPRAVRDDPL